jgi:hypothetical protein
MLLPTILTSKTASVLKRTLKKKTMLCQYSTVVGMDRAARANRNVLRSTGSIAKNKARISKVRRVMNVRIRAIDADDVEEDDDKVAKTLEELRTARLAETKRIRNLFVQASFVAAAVATVLVSKSGLYDIDILEELVGNERDPVRSLSVYGSVQKEYRVDRFDDVGHVVGRSRGVSVTSCAQLVPYTGDSRGDRGDLEPRNRDFRECQLVTEKMDVVESAADIAPSCQKACELSCTNAVKAYDKDQLKRFGFGFIEEDRTKITKSCARNCYADCLKAGTGSYNFLIPFRF